MKQNNKINREEITSALPKRKKDAYKGDFGHVLVIGGDDGMPGAVRMAGEAALRVGAGLVSIATHAEHTAAIVANRPELMCHGVKTAKDLQPLFAKSTVIILGPGLGQSAWSRKMFTAVMKAKQPKIVDADALNLLAKKPFPRQDWILTPHVGEASRLLKATTGKIQKNRSNAAGSLQKKYGGVIVLKGAGSLVQGKKLGLCKAGNPGMSTGGMGDILSGIIGGLVAQKLDLETAARIGVLTHALAGDLVAKEKGERGMLASDLLDYLPQIINKR